jgi:hypothetical protein
LFILGFHVIYNGLDTEYLLEQLIPGHLYSLRLSCSSIGGHSDPSDITQIKTPAVAPASCHPPKISGKAKANSLHLRWGKRIKFMYVLQLFVYFSIS